MSAYLPFKSLAEYIELAEEKVKNGELYIAEAESPEELERKLKRRKSPINIMSMTSFFHVLMWFLIIEGGSLFKVTPLTLIGYNVFLIATTAVTYHTMKSFMMIQKKEESGYIFVFSAQVLVSATLIMLLAQALQSEWSLNWFHLSIYLLFLIELIAFAWYGDIIQIKWDMKKSKKDTKK